MAHDTHQPIVGDTILVEETLQLIWRSGTSRFHLPVPDLQIDELVQERRNSSASAMELRLSCINSSWDALTPIQT